MDRPPLRVITRVTLAFFIALSSWGQSVACTQEPPSRSERVAPTSSPLCRAVVASNVSLTASIDRAGARGRQPLRAAFALDAQGQLGLTVLMTSLPSARTDAHDASTGFEEWAGPVYDGCWAPRRRGLTERSSIEDAQRLHALLTSGRVSLWGAAKRAELVKHERAGASRRLLAIEPCARGETVAFASTLSVDGVVHRLEQARTTQAVLSLVPTDEPSRRATPVQSTALPDFSVAGGAWFGTDEPVTLESLKGAPVLVAVTDPG